MRSEKRKKLEAAGWKVGSASDFLGLTAEEKAYIEVKLLLSERLKKERTKRHLSQDDLAARLGSSQSRVAKMEAGDPSVSVDLLIRGLLAAGVSKKEIGKLFVSAP